MSGVGDITEDEVKSVYSLPFKISKGSLIDFETTGIPKLQDTHEIVTLGYMVEDKLVIIQRKTPDKQAFYADVRKVLRNLPRPFYSYNATFERDIISIELGLENNDTDFVDLMRPWKRKAAQYGKKWPRLDDLISEPEDYFEEGKISGAKVPELWMKYLSNMTNKGILKLIMDHCFSDVMREATLLLRYPGYQPDARA